jgi:lipopolysaccharide transport system ATP-binding protein
LTRAIAEWREQLQATNIGSGPLMLMEEWLPSSARIQESWVKSGENIVRYEGLLQKDFEILEQVLIQQCGLSIGTERLREIVHDNRFENATGGRKPGEENRDSHERKGIAGDWRNYFTSGVTKNFNAQYGTVLVSAGYDLAD